jgi:hypothetical protein
MTNRKSSCFEKTVHFKWLDVIRYLARTDEGLFGEHFRVSTLRRKFYVWLGKFLGTGEKEELRSDIQEQEHIDCAG